MSLGEFLAAEWLPALGCTEPASIALAGLTASKHLGEAPKKVILRVDSKIYKNCYAVGIPGSGHKTGVKWAAGIGAFLTDKGLGLQCFNAATRAVLRSAAKLIEKGGIGITIDKSKKNLFVDFTAVGASGRARCVIEGAHTNITLISKNGRVIYKNAVSRLSSAQAEARKWAASLSMEEIIKKARALSPAQRGMIFNGARQNLKIARHGLKLFPEDFFRLKRPDVVTKIAGLVCAGVYARMWGEPFPVMSVAGSGNKGIVISVPLVLLKDEWKISRKKIEEALLIAMLVTSRTTHELGSLSAVCGCSNAAGIGLACAIVYVKGGGKREMSFAISNMVGNITGMICDGAKIGCALKTMTSVDAAFRSATLAIHGIGIPPEDGIVGKDGSSSLKNMGAIANIGMIGTDEEILKIMERKLQGK